VSVLLKEQIPHNVIAVKGGTSVFVLPRKAGPSEPRPTWIESSGIGICRQKQLYDDLTAEMYEDILKKDLCLDEADFQEVKESVLSVIQ